jgi:hypothetical protein
MNGHDRVRRMHNVRKLRETQRPKCGHTGCWESAIAKGDRSPVRCMQVPLTQHETDCEICEGGPYEGKPGHYGALYCETKTSLASGGTFRHCTCKVCLEEA